MVTDQAAVVVEQALIHHLADLCAGDAACSTADKAAEDGSSNGAERHAWWTGNDTYGSSESGARHGTGDSLKGSTDKANSAAGVFGDVAAGDVRGLARGTVNSHVETPMWGSKQNTPASAAHKGMADAGVFGSDVRFGLSNHTG